MRWFSLLPAAFLASVAVQLVTGAVTRSANPGGSAPASIGFWLWSVPNYVLPEIAFELAGGSLAPRKRMAVVFLLMLLGGILSLLKHVVGQQLAGNSVGNVNYAHCGLEIAGLLAGAVYFHRLTGDPYRIAQHEDP